MDWTDSVRLRLKRRNQLLFQPKDEYLQDLASLVCLQPHKVLVLWAFELAGETVQILEQKYPQEKSPQNALEVSKLWAAGKIKMPVAKREILRCHAFAKTIFSLEDIARFHAVAQACSVVHTVGHAMGYPIYDLTAIVRSLGLENCCEAVERRRQSYEEKLLFWSAQVKNRTQPWAEFMDR